jgi:fructokinase
VDGGFRPLIFGETLFDHFPDGSQVLGGAPFNVAWHLRGFKADPLLISSVGRDPEGEIILKRMREWGMVTGGVQLHAARPTGRVTARFESGEPVYEIEANQAYDDVSPEGIPEETTLREGHLLYHGSLALREAGSRSTLDQLLDRVKAPRLVDVNLRAPWWEREVVLPLLEGAEWVKLNRDEAAQLAGGPVETRQSLEETGRSLKDALGIETLVVTMGAEGAVALTSDGTYWEAAPEVTDGVDPVGAGDAFSAVLALGIHGNWAVEVILARAVAFAADLCRIRGATGADRELYSTHLRRWGHAD